MDSPRPCYLTSSAQSLRCDGGNDTVYSSDCQARHNATHIEQNPTRAGYKLRIELAPDVITKPRILRTIVVPGNFTFYQLNRTIQVVFGWSPKPTYEFWDEQYHWWIPYHKLRFISDELVCTEAVDTCISELFDKDPKIKWIYEHDVMNMHTDWRHCITVLERCEPVLYPRCIHPSIGHEAAEDTTIEEWEYLKGLYNSKQTAIDAGTLWKNKHLKRWYQNIPDPEADLNIHQKRQVGCLNGDRLGLNDGAVYFCDIEAINESLLGLATELREPNWRDYQGVQTRASMILDRVEVN